MLSYRRETALRQK